MASLSYVSYNKHFEQSCTYTVLSVFYCFVYCFIVCDCFTLPSQLSLQCTTAAMCINKTKLHPVSDRVGAKGMSTPESRPHRKAEAGLSLKCFHRPLKVSRDICSFWNQHVLYTPRK